MNQALNVYALPSYTTEEELAGGTVVVIDVLRACTTMIQAFESGAVAIVPCLEIEDAQAMADRLGRADVVLGGERNCVPIEGFDLGNSPGDYTPYAVSGKTIVFSSTNGTRALQLCRKSRRVLLGAFVNASAVLARLDGQTPIHLLCSGSGGEISRDDILFAGLLVDRLMRRGDVGFQCNVQALVSRENWLSSFALPVAIGAEPVPAQQLVGELRKSLAGQKLVAAGLEDDLFEVAQIDRYSIVPEYDIASGRIRDTTTAR
jgi:2-phosphosulfolactate phosphatase